MKIPFLKSIVLQLYIFSWNDIFEIFCFSLASYYCIRWLNKDSSKNLALSFYGLTTVIACSSFFYLPTIHGSLLLFLPCFFLVFYAIHSATLQKNLVQLTGTLPTPIYVNNDDWATTLIQTSLHIPASKLPIYFIIERTHELSLFLESDCYIRSPIGMPLMRLLIESTHISPHAIFWFTHYGELKAVNAHWKIQSTMENSEYMNNIAQAHTLTQNTDSLCITRNTEDKGYTIIAQNNRIEEVSAAHTIRIIKQYCLLPQAKKKGVPYAQSFSPSTRNTQQQT